MNRRDFLKAGALALASAPPALVADAASKDPEFARGAVELPPPISDFEYVSNPALKGKFASFFIDDAIWFLRDLARQRPKSLFDNAFLKPLKESAPHLFKSNGQGGYNPAAGGAGSAGGVANPWKKESFNLTEQDKILKTDQTLARQLAAAAGVTLPI